MFNRNKRSIKIAFDQKSFDRSTIFWSITFDRNIFWRIKRFWSIKITVTARTSTYIRIRGPGGLVGRLGAAGVGRGAEIECFSQGVSRGGFVRFRTDFGGVLEAEDGQKIDFVGSSWRPFSRKRFRKVFSSIFGRPEPRKSSSCLRGSTIFAKSTFSKKVAKNAGLGVIWDS